MFPEPPRAQKRLSRLYAEHYNYARPEFRPSYQKLKTAKPLPCDECFAEQHETKGASGQRLVANTRRTIKQGAALNLCPVHDELWKRRDAATGDTK